MQLGRGRRKSLGSKENNNNAISAEAGMEDGDVRKVGRVATVEV